MTAPSAADAADQASRAWRERLRVVLFGTERQVAALAASGAFTRETILAQLRQAEAAHAASASAAPVRSASPDRDGGGT